MHTARACSLEPTFTVRFRKPSVPWSDRVLEWLAAAASDPLKRNVGLGLLFLRRNRSESSQEDVYPLVEAALRHTWETCTLIEQLTQWARVPADLQWVRLMDIFARCSLPTSNAPSKLKSLEVRADLQFMVELLGKSQEHSCTPASFRVVVPYVGLRGSAPLRVRWQDRWRPSDLARRRFMDVFGENGTGIPDVRMLDEGVRMLLHLLADRGGAELSAVIAPGEPLEWVLELPQWRLRSKP